MPGFVDTHRHVWRSLFRNLGDGVSDLGPHYRADDVYAATLIGLLGAADAGITTVVDWSDPLQDGSMAEAALEAHVDSGMRTMLVVPQVEALRRLQSGSGGEMTTFGFGATVGGPPEAWALARQAGARVFAHIGDGQGWGERGGGAWRATRA